MNVNEIKREIEMGKWDQYLIDNILKSNNYEIFKMALKREDCPLDLILDLWQCPDPTVRELICVHPKTPKNIIKKIVAKETDPRVKSIATKVLEGKNEE